MRIHPIIKSTILVAPLVLILGIMGTSAQAADQSLTAAITSAPTITPAPTGEASGVASGAVEDTLSACMARIPKDASDGQRMMAEESCNRDEGSRTVSQVAPTF